MQEVVAEKLEALFRRLGRDARLTTESGGTVTLVSTNPTYERAERFPEPGREVAKPAPAQHAADVNPR